MTRLQGQQFKNMKPFLMLLGYQKSNNGHIRAIMKLKTNKQTHIGAPTKYMYSHWLNPEEEQKFKQSEFYKTHEPLGFELYEHSFKKEKANEQI